MAIVVTGISLPIDLPSEAAFEEARRRLHLPSGQGETFYLIKSGVDARRRRDIHFVYTVGVNCQDEEKVAARAGEGVSLRRSFTLDLPVGDRPIPHRPVVVGFGPGGIFSALLLARAGLRPLVLERGADMDTRVQAVEEFWRRGRFSRFTNVQFGEGGAGTFSDGKLTTRINDPRCEFVLRELAAHGAPQEILHRAKPHIGTDYLRGVVKSIRKEILELGGEVRFDTQVTGISLSGAAVRGVRLEGGEIPCEAVVLAVGHSARDTFAQLWTDGVKLESKPFSVGMRIEHLQREIDKGLYGELAGHPALPKGEYQLSHRSNGRGVYTFCMCPGGVVVSSSSEEGGVVTNGMSEYLRDGRNANSAVVVSVDKEDFGADWQAGVAFQRRLEQAAFTAGGGNYRAPAQTVGNFLAGRGGITWGKVEPSYPLGVFEGDFKALLPASLSGPLQEGLRAFGRKLPGFDASDALLTGLETRTSSPVRIPRTESLEAVSAKGLYPCGEGAGYAGGIMSAAVDGVRVAQGILSVYRAAERV